LDASRIRHPDETVDKLDQVKPSATPDTQPPSVTDSGDLSTIGVGDQQQGPSVDAPQSDQAQKTSTDTSTDNIDPVEDSFNI